MMDLSTNQFVSDYLAIKFNLLLRHKTVNMTTEAIGRIIKVDIRPSLRTKNSSMSFFSGISLKDLRIMRYFNGAFLRDRTFFVKAWK
jgi:hypothetical protein